MTDLTRRRIVRGAVFVGVLGALIGPASLLITDHPNGGLVSLLLTAGALALGFGVVAWVAAGSQPGNRVVWASASFVVGTGVFVLGLIAKAALAPDIQLPLDVETTVPAALPPAVARVQGWTTAVATFGTLTMLTFGIVLFPTGTLPSRRWRPFAGLLIAGIIASSIGQVAFWDPQSEVAPFGLDGPGHRAWYVSLFQLLGPAGSVLGLVVRFRRGDQVTRSQVKWIMWAAAILVPTALISFQSSNTYLMLVGGLVFVTAYGVAITKYRLYEIDVVISKSLVYGILALVIGAVYVVVVVGAGAVLSDASLALSITATALVAIIFEPVRARAQKWANRLVFGSRATPYEVLSDLTGRLAEAEDGESLLERMTQRLAESTGAGRAIVWTLAADGHLPVAVSPFDEHPGDGVIPTEGLPGFVRPIEHEGEMLGALTVEKERGDALTPTDEHLVEDLAASAGLVLRRRRLDRALAAKAAELHDSRRRLVDAQDVERRRLERDLHDGAQQQTVALRVKLGLARRLAAEEGAERALALLDQMEEDAQRAIDQIRALAQGIYPPLLEAEGLGAAIPAMTAFSPYEVSTDINLHSRHPQATEGAVYFCISEALTNAAKHALGPIRVTVADTDQRLTFTVTDSGPGFDVERASRGAGLSNMSDRVEALGGDLVVSSSAGGETSVRGWLPATAKRKATSV